MRFIEHIERTRKFYVNSTSGITPKTADVVFKPIAIPLRGLTGLQLRAWGSSSSVSRPGGGVDPRDGFSGGPPFADESRSGTLGFS